VTFFISFTKDVGAWIKGKDVSDVVVLSPDEVMCSSIALQVIFVFDCDCDENTIFVRYVVGCYYHTVELRKKRAR